MQDEYSLQSIKLKSNKIEKYYTVANTNTFYLFFKDIFKSIENENYLKYLDTMEIDCKTLETLRPKI